MPGPEQRERLTYDNATPEQVEQVRESFRRRLHAARSTETADARAAVLREVFGQPAAA